MMIREAEEQNRPENEDAIRGMAKVETVEHDDEIIEA